MSRPHQLNSNFVWEDRPLTGLSRLSAPQVSKFNNDGFITMKQAITGDFLNKIIVEVDSFAANAPASTLVDYKGEVLAKYAKDELSFACNLVAKSSILADFYRSRLFSGITRDLLGRACRLYWDQAVYKYPQKGGEFPWHQDNGYTFVSPQQYLTCWLALSDAPVEAGCPWVIPGAHRFGTYLHIQQPYGLEIDDVRSMIKQYGEVPAPVSAGDMVIFSSLTPHKTGPNLGNNIRKALIIQFAHDGAVRIEEDSEILLNDPVLNPLLSLRTAEG